MKKIFIFCFLFTTFFCTHAFAQGQLTLTTYYPAPFGMYEDLRVNNAVSIGTTASPGTARLHVNGNVGIGTTSPMAMMDVRDGPGFSPLGAQPATFVGTAQGSKTALYAFSVPATSAAPANVGSAAVVAHGTDWGIYSDLGKNYFAGRVGIATTNSLLSTLRVASVPADNYTAIIEQQSAGASKYALMLYKQFAPFSPMSEGALFIGASNGYGIFQQGNAPNYFQSKIGLGTTDFGTYAYGKIVAIGDAASLNTGMYAVGSFAGLTAESSAGTGVGASGATTGVYAAGPTGVEAIFTQPTGVGVYGHNSNGINGGTGVYGYSWGGTGVKGENPSPVGLAGDFAGKVRVSSGTWTATRAGATVGYPFNTSYWTNEQSTCPNNGVVKGVQVLKDPVDTDKFIIQLYCTNGS